MKKFIRKHCEECYGEGENSSCCGDGVDDNKCISCGKFCHTEGCYNCNGQGYNDFHVGDEVEIFVCIHSSEYLKKNLYKSKKLGDSKFFRGKIAKLIGKDKVQVKLRNKTIRVDIEEVSTF